MCHAKRVLLPLNVCLQGGVFVFNFFKICLPKMQNSITILVASRYWTLSSLDIERGGFCQLQVAANSIKERKKYFLLLIFSSKILKPLIFEFSSA